MILPKSDTELQTVIPRARRRYFAFTRTTRGLAIHYGKQQHLRREDAVYPKIAPSSVQEGFDLVTLVEMCPEAATNSVCTSIPILSFAIPQLVSSVLIRMNGSDLGKESLSQVRIIFRLLKSYPATLEP